VISRKAERTAGEDAIKGILLKDANLLDAENGLLKSDLDILIEGGMIKEVGEAIRVDGEKWRQIDCSSKFALSPNKKANILILNRNPLEDTRNLKSVHTVLHNVKHVTASSQASIRTGRDPGHLGGLAAQCPGKKT
jgi:imidazolonepropionase-like amidohydrolase